MVMKMINTDTVAPSLSAFHNALHTKTGLNKTIVFASNKHSIDSNNEFKKVWFAVVRLYNTDGQNDSLVHGASLETICYHLKRINKKWDFHPKKLRDALRIAEDFGIVEIKLNSFGNRIIKPLFLRATGGAIRCKVTQPET